MLSKDASASVTQSTSTNLCNRHHSTELFFSTHSFSGGAEFDSIPSFRRVQHIAKASLTHPVTK